MRFARLQPEGARWGCNKLSFGITHRRTTRPRSEKLCCPGPHLPNSSARSARLPGRSESQSHIREVREPGARVEAVSLGSGKFDQYKCHIPYWTVAQAGRSESRYRWFRHCLDCERLWV
jgi:hypothetical protein